MDYFYVGNHSNNVGLNDFFVKFNRKSGKMTYTGFIHQFYSAAKVLDPENTNSSLSNNMGIEVDLSIGYKIAENINVTAGYSQMFGTSTLEALKGGDMDEMSNWAWLMFSFKPVFINK